MGGGSGSGAFQDLEMRVLFLFIPVRRFPAADVWNWRGGVQVGVPRFQDLAVRFQVFHLGGGGGGGAVGR